MIIRTFNLTYFLLLFFILSACILITCLLRGKSEDIKRKVMYGLCYFNIFLFVIYKVYLKIGNQELLDKGYRFNIWLELPIQLCNISLFLVPLGLYKKHDFLYAYGFYIAPLGALMALTFPEPAFTNTNLFYFHNIGFYFTHANIIINGVLLVTLGFFKPSFKKVPSLLIFIIVLTVASFLVNLSLRALFHVPANYFFSYEPVGISILELFWKILPVRCIYLSFGLIILIAYVSVITIPFQMCRKKEQEESEVAEMYE